MIFCLLLIEHPGRAARCGTAVARVGGRVDDGGVRPVRLPVLSDARRQPLCPPHTSIIELLDEGNTIQRRVF